MIKKMILLVLVFLSSLFCEASENPHRFTVLFTGDTHSHLKQTDKIAQAILMEKQNPDNGVIIVADAGDMLTGTEYYDLSYGTLEFEMMHLVGYNIATIGNHEFDKGWPHLKNLLAQTKFDFVCANIYDIQTNQLILEPYKIFSFGALKIAFVGIMGKDAWNSIRPTAKQGLALSDPNTVLNELLPQLQPSVNAIILLSHSGIASDRLYAAKHENLTAILGGHSHTYMSEPEIIRVGNKTIPIFHSSKFGEFLGKLTVDCQEKKFYTQLLKMDSSKEAQGNLTLVQEQIKNDLLSINEQLEEIYSKTISTVAVPMSKLEIKKGVAPLGRDFICHILKEVSGSDVSFYPTNGIRLGLEKGPITLKTIFNMLYYDSLVTYRISGSALLQLMNEGESRWSSGSRTFQNKGIMLNPLNHSYFVNGEPLQEKAIYNVSGPSYFFEREFFDSDGTIFEKYANDLNPDYEEYPDDVRTVIIDWLKNNDLPPYIKKDL